MIARPTPEQLATLKAECRRRFGHERMVGVPLAHPVDAFVVLASWSLAEAGAHADARLVSIPNAASVLVADRALYPAPELLDPLRERFGALDVEIERAFRKALGFVVEDPMIAELSVISSPPAFASVKAAPEKIAALGGGPLHVVSSKGNGLSLIMREPSGDVVIAVGTAADEAQRARRGAISWATGYARDLCVWAPGSTSPADAAAAFDRHLAELPGRAADIGPALLAMGGAGAGRRAEFL